ncbi:hypothetical protein [Pseudoflavonifractor sp. 524-17]|nr:hypothetical protein [Pseudoflavonifractor sp. 524-17]
MSEKKTNNERFNEMLNTCQNPQAVAAALLILAENGLFQRKEATV